MKNTRHEHKRAIEINAIQALVIISLLFDLFAILLEFEFELVSGYQQSEMRIVSVFQYTNTNSSYSYQCAFNGILILKIIENKKNPIIRRRKRNNSKLDRFQTIDCTFLYVVKIHHKPNVIIV